jgi:hypothetical protein
LHGPSSVIIEPLGNDISSAATGPPPMLVSLLPGCPVPVAWSRQGVAGIRAVTDSATDSGTGPAMGLATYNVRMCAGW